MSDVKFKYTQALRNYFEVHPNRVHGAYIQAAGGWRLFKLEHTLAMLKDFAQWWVDNTTGEVIPEEFTYRGLCSNFQEWIGHIQPPSTRPLIGEHADTDFLSRLFWVTVAGKPVYIDEEEFRITHRRSGSPTNYPFGGEDLYDQELDDGTMHLNPERIEWINSVLEA